MVGASGTVRRNHADQNKPVYDKDARDASHVAGLIVRSHHGSIMLFSKTGVQIQIKDCLRPAIGHFSKIKDPKERFRSREISCFQNRQRCSSPKRMVSTCWEESMIEERETAWQRTCVKDVLASVKSPSRGSVRPIRWLGRIT